MAAMPGSDKDAAVLRTKQLIEQGEEIIYEAAFRFDGVLVLLDILVKQRGKWFAYEVKSSGRVSAAYVLDASLQHYVIVNSGLPLEDIFIAHINSQYVRSGDVEPDQLFTIVSVKTEALRNSDTIAEKVAAAKAVLETTISPDIEIGEQCFSPYTCDFKGHCWKHIPRNSIFDVSGMPRQQQFELYRSGVMRVEDIPMEYVLEKQSRVHVDTVISNEPLINREGLMRFLYTLRYPLYFLDFETFMPAVPMFDRTRPYQHIPFQYSLHYKQSKESEPQHLHFLAEAGYDPRKYFIEKLLEDTQGPGDILVYDAMLEKAVLKALANDLPVYAEEINERLLRIRDLAVPFQEKLYYHPAMRGSHSIKNVLPALVPGITYDDLKINSGNIAMSAFEQLQRETDMFAIEEIREALHEYCRMDTLAMVKLLEVLEQAVE